MTEPSEEMVERVARAIFFLGGEQNDEHWEYVQAHYRERAYEQARAAISAMQLEGVPVYKTELAEKGIPGLATKDVPDE